MSAILKIKIPFYKKATHDSSDGLATFYLASQPKYLPTSNQTVLITHTEVQSGTGLDTKLKSLSTNTVPALFDSFTQNVNQASISVTDNYSNFMILKYLDSSFSTQTFAGNCRGFIEYDVNPQTYSILKPIESSVIVNETVPFDGDTGYKALYCTPSGYTTTSKTDILPACFISRKETNTIFANLLQSLNLPVSDDDLLKYSRTAYGYYRTPATNETPTTTIGGQPQVWVPLTTSTLPSGINAYYTHPVSGETGEYCNTVLQHIGSHSFVTDLNVLPVPNDMYLIFEIPAAKYGEIIDGKSISFTLPYWTGVTNTNLTKKSLGILASYSSTIKVANIYGTYNLSHLNTDNLDNALSEKDLSLQDLGARPDLSSDVSTYNSNVVLLFSDNIATPYENSTGSWGTGNSQVLDGIRVFNPKSREKLLYTYQQDQCVGVAYLDKGFVVITHPLIVDSIFVNAFNGQITTGGTSNNIKIYNMYGNVAANTSLKRNRPLYGGLQIYTGKTANPILTKDSNGKVLWESSQFLFTGTTTAQLQYLSYNTEKTLNIVMLASSNEFFKSTNSTAKQLFGNLPDDDFANFNTSDGNLYPVIITGIGIHDSSGNLLGIAKPTQPITKYYFDIVGLNAKIRL